MFFSSIRAAEAKDYEPAHKSTQPGVTVYGLGLVSVTSATGATGATGATVGSYTASAETAVEQRAAKIILENI